MSSYDWVYDETVDLTQYLGFVYIIRNLTDGRKYIGQKKLWGHKYSQKKNPKTGKVKKTKIKIESDWRSYWGSSVELQADVEKLGPENFTREIIKFCKTKGEMNYEELREQVLNDVLRDDTYYNSYIGGRIHAKHLPGRGTSGE